MKNFFKFIISFLLSTSLYAQHLKKDGTPDMRYKENKETTSSYAYPTSLSNSSSTSTYDNTSPHLKKDGTPDMRYKENSEASSTSTTTVIPKYTSNTNNSYIVKRDAEGKIERNQAATYEFKKQTGYPNGRPGYVIDHIKPLKKGGCDCPENMQWQTNQAAKEKDKWE